MHPDDPHHLRAVAEADGQAAHAEQATREAQAWELNVEQSASHSAVERAHAARILTQAEAWQALAVTLKAAAAVGTLYALASLPAVLRHLW